MAEGRATMKELQGLLTDHQLVEHIAKAKDVDEITALLNEAGSRTSVSFDAGWVADVVTDVKVARSPVAPTVEELHHLASTRMMSDTPPKLCHTDSCGGHPTLCC
jgi:hypothetical protein